MHTLTTIVTIEPTPATEDGALDGFKATCQHGCTASFSIESMTRKWASDHVRLMTEWGK